MHRHTLALALILATGGPAAGQTLNERIDGLRGRHAATLLEDPRFTQQQSIAARLRRPVEAVDLQAVEAREAFLWWSRTTGIPLVMDWEALALEGVNPTAPITIELQNVPADRLLELLLRTTSDFTEFIYEIEPGFVQVMTKPQANRHPVVRVYDVRDLVVEIPTFDNAPSFSLTDALSNTSSGGGGSGGGSEGLFGDEDEDDEDEEQLTTQERGEQLAELVRTTIEPTIWQANGGDAASIRYFNGRLVVRAPRYVQRQIGIPVAVPTLPPLGGRVAVPEPVRVESPTQGPE